MVIMLGKRRLCPIFLLVTAIGMVTASLAQDAPEAPAAPAQSEAPAVTPVQDDGALATQVEQLRAEVDQLKQQVAYLNGLIEQLQEGRGVVEKSAAKRLAPPKNATSAKKKTASAAPPVLPSIVPEIDDRAPMTVLVFHDGHKTEARNYAIVGQTLWIYTEQDSKKVPLADLDVAATKEANSDRGITFQLPPTR